MPALVTLRRAIHVLDQRQVWAVRTDQMAIGPQISGVNSNAPRHHCGSSECSRKAYAFANAVWPSITGQITSRRRVMRRCGQSRSCVSTRSPNKTSTIDRFGNQQCGVITACTKAAFGHEQANTNVAKPSSGIRRTNSASAARQPPLDSKRCGCICHLFNPPDLLWQAKLHKKLKLPIQVHRATCVSLTASPVWVSVRPNFRTF